MDRRATDGPHGDGTGDADPDFAPDLDFAPDPDEDDTDDNDDADEAAEEEDEGRPGGLAGGPPPGSPFDRTGRKAPAPALINITVPIGTLLGWSGTPADVGTWGLMEAATARDRLPVVRA